MANTMPIATRVRSLFLPEGLFSERYRLDESTLQQTGATRWEAHVYPRATTAPHLLRVHVLDGGGPVASQYWQTEARALRRIAARHHRSLPRLVDAQLLPEQQLGVLLVEDTGLALTPQHPGLAAVQGDHRRGLRLFLDLCEAVATLHLEDMIHRAITPLAVRAGEALTEVSIDDFGMSALARTVLRGGLRSEAAQAPDDPLVCAFLAPERLATLCGAKSAQVEGFTCDVFGLGLFGAMLFGISMPNAEGIVVGGEYDAERHARWIAEVRDAVNNASLPRELRRLFGQMMEVWPAGRPASANEVLASLLRLREGLTAQFDHSSQNPLTPPHKVRFLAETITRLHREGLARSTPDDPDYEEYAEIIARDLEHGSVVWSPQGFQPWDTSAGVGRPEGAKIVLIGRVFSYFAEYLDAIVGRADERALQIKYLTHTSQLRALVSAPRRRSLPAVEALYHDPRSRGQLKPAAGDPSWRDHADAVPV